jgi:hypothetical protein
MFVSCEAMVGQQSDRPIALISSLRGQSSVGLDFERSPDATVYAGSLEEKLGAMDYESQSLCEFPISFLAALPSNIRVQPGQLGDGLEIQGRFLPRCTRIDLKRSFLFLSANRKAFASVQYGCPAAIDLPLCFRRKRFLGMETVVWPAAWTQVCRVLRLCIRCYVCCWLVGSCLVGEKHNATCLEVVCTVIVTTSPARTQWLRTPSVIVGSGSHLAMGTTAVVEARLSR